MSYLPFYLFIYKSFDTVPLNQNLVLVWYKNIKYKIVKVDFQGALYKKYYIYIYIYIYKYL